MIAAVLGALLIAAPTGAAAQPCRPIAGAEQLWTNDQVRWILVGERHGTAEIPAIFGDLLCLASAHSGRPIVVALEHPVEEQARIDAFLASDGGPNAISAFLKGPIWRQSRQDGRTSQAYLDLFERLRTMIRRGQVERVVAFQPEMRSNPAAYERAMADALKRASTSDEELMIALVGNIHAMAKPVSFGPEQPYLRAAGWLPPDRILTLNAVGNGGSTWGCISALPEHIGPGLHIGCGSQDFGPRRKSHPRGVVLGQTPDQPWSGQLNLGVVTTASPPAVSKDEQPAS